MFNFEAFIAYAFVVSFTPGPNNIMCMASGNKNGLRKTLPFIAGIVSGFIIILWLSSLFNLVLAAQIPKFIPFMKIIGAAYMLYLMLKILEIHPLKYIFKAKAKKVHNFEDKPLKYYNGVTLQFLNFKAILYALTITSNFIIPYYDSPLILLMFSLLLGCVTFCSNLSWTLFGSVFNRFLARYNRPFNLLMAVLLIYSALSILGWFHN